MSDWYIYYRVLHALNSTKSINCVIILQDVLVELRGKAHREFPKASEQEITDWFNHLSTIPRERTEEQVAYLTRTRSWGGGV